MSYKKFFADFYGFLLNPRETTKYNLNNEEFRNNFRLSNFLVLYLAISIGITLLYFLGYPESLYYGTSYEGLQKEIPSIFIADPLLYLLFLIGMRNIYRLFIFDGIKT